VQKVVEVVDFGIVLYIDLVVDNMVVLQEL
jgi:hypothetical protein